MTPIFAIQVQGFEVMMQVPVEQPTRKIPETRQRASTCEQAGRIHF